MRFHSRPSNLPFERSGDHVAVRGRQSDGLYPAIGARDPDAAAARIMASASAAPM
jgi:hypothetical protein